MGKLRMLCAERTDQCPGYSDNGVAFCGGGGHSGVIIKDYFSKISEME